MRSEPGQRRNRGKTNSFTTKDTEEKNGRGRTGSDISEPVGPGKEYTNPDGSRQRYKGSQEQYAPARGFENRPSESNQTPDAPNAAGGDGGIKYLFDSDAPDADPTKKPRLPDPEGQSQSGTPESWAPYQTTPVRTVWTSPAPRTSQAAYSTPAVTTYQPVPAVTNYRSSVPRYTVPAPVAVPGYQGLSPASVLGVDTAASGGGNSPRHLVQLDTPRVHERASAHAPVGGVSMRIGIDRGDVRSGDAPQSLLARIGSF